MIKLKLKSKYEAFKNKVSLHHSCIIETFSEENTQEANLTEEQIIRQQKNALFDHLLKSLSAFPTPSISRSPIAAIRRQNSEDDGSKYSQNRQFRVRVASVLSPKHLMTR